MSDLKLCPFCGGEAERVDRDAIDGSAEADGGSYIHCVRCDAATAIHYDRKENLVSSWNDRRVRHEDFDHLADCLRGAVADCDEATLRALLSNNVNTIIAALTQGA